MAHKYKLQLSRADHPVRLRPFLHEMRDDLAKLEAPILADLEKIEAMVLDRRHRAPTPVPPDPTPTPPPQPPAPAPSPTAAVDMLPLLQDTGDQGQQGSCFSFAGTHAQNLCEALAPATPAPSPVTYSEACLSWNTRVRMGTSDQDSGGNLCDAIQVQEQVGTSLSALMPYNDEVFNVAPDAAAVADEANHKAKFKAYPVDLSDPANIDKALADGYPVYLGFWVWQGFENTGTDGIVPPPDGSNLGGHAQLFFATDISKLGWTDAWPDQNSWGAGWGLNGRCGFPRSAASTIMEAYALVPVAAA